MNWLLSYLLNGVWQIPLLFMGAWMTGRMLRRAGPQLEHSIWVGALLLQIALPACNLQVAALWRALLNLLPSHGVSGYGSVRVLFGPATAVGSTLHLSHALVTAMACAWASVALYFVLRLGWGILQTRNLARSVTSIDLPGDAAERWISHCARFGVATPPRLAASPYATAPVAIGLLHGMVILPPDLLDTISPNDLDAVLAHELAHIARRDFAKNLIYSLLALPIAWHPLTWRTRARLAECRELICDEAAASVAGCRQYAQSLLRLASAFAGQPRLAAVHAVGILDFSTTRALERRVMNLTSKRTPMSTSRRILLATACSVLALATCASALALHTEIAAQGSSSTAENKTPTKIHVKSDIMTGLKISGDMPHYPPEARQKRIQGAVVLDTTISKEGVVENLRVMKSPAESLSQSALDAVRTWRYHPYLLNGDPVEVETTINVIYNLGG
jgi:TonB family protein